MVDFGFKDGFKDHWAGYIPLALALAPIAWFVYLWTKLPASAWAYISEADLVVLVALCIAALLGMAFSSRYRQYEDQLKEFDKAYRHGERLLFYVRQPREYADLLTSADCQELAKKWLEFQTDIDELVWTRMRQQKAEEIAGRTET